MKTALTIAGSDCSGGAGIQADLKTFTVHGIYGMSVITSVTVQNTMGVYDKQDIPDYIIEKQIDAVYTDIVPDAVKIGMISNEEVIEAVSKKLEYYKCKNVVLDTVMVSTSGFKLINDNCIEKLKQNLISKATIITPNIPEAEVLSNTSIKTVEDMVKAAKIISEFTEAAILIKGGHLLSCADDLLYYKGEIIWFKAKHINNKNTHGTGCTLSSAIASNLAYGLDICEAVKQAKEYVHGAIEDGFNIGNGNGPLNHMYCMGDNKYVKK